MNKFLWQVVVIIWAGISFVMIPNIVIADMDPDTSTELIARSRHIYKTDVDAVTGQIAVNESQFGFAQNFEIDRLPVTAGFKIKHIDINENIPTNLPSELVGKELQLGVKLPAPWLDSDHYFVGVDIFPSMYTDDWDYKASAFRIPFRTYLIYKETEDLIWVAGILVRPQYHTSVLPVLGLIYRPNDRLSFNLASDDPNIAYKIDDKLTALAEFGLVTDEYEVTRGNQNGVVLKYSELSAGGGFKYDVTPNIQAKISIGAVFNRKIDYRDDVGKVHPDGGLYTDFKLSAKF